ncbi:MAG: FtsW/RodA/SpoVE family cell cycle protein, partial [Thermoanaerobaculia bacterium]
MRSTSGTLSSFAGLPEESAALRHLARVRWGLLVAALLLSLVGLATVHSASSEMGIDYLPRQALWVALGMVVFLVAFSVDHQTLTKFAWPIYLTGVALLVLVLLFGQEAGGSRSWLGIGSYRIQPSEFAKISTALMLARYLAGANRRYLRLPQIAIVVLLVGVPMALVALSPDLGGAAMFVPMVGGMLVVAGIRWRFVAAGAITIALLGAGLWHFVMLDYQKDRVMTFVSPDRDPLGAGYHLQQSKIAVGSGQVAGR